MDAALAKPPDLQPAVLAVSAYASEHQGVLPPEHAQILLEIRRRLNRLQSQAAELIEINNQLWAKNDMDVSFDSDADTIIFRVGGQEQCITLNRADPAVPIQMGQLTTTSAYHAGNPEPIDDEEARLQVELEEKLESYYQSAHRVLKLFGRIPALAKIKSNAISRVRNELIEHPSDGALYSFGAGSHGPRMKPLQKGSPTFTDQGLVPNTNELVDAIIQGCRATSS